MSRTVTSLVLLLIVVAGVGLYQLKYKTQRLQQEVSAIETGLVADQAAIRVLEAEWTYLTRPERIAALSRRYLALEPTTGDQVAASVDVIGRRDDTDAVLAQVDDFRGAAVVLARAPAAPRRGPVVQPDREPDAPVLEAKRDDGPALFERIRLVLMEDGYE